MRATGDRNRLGKETSPHLRAHADDPVNWQPWDERTLAVAREHERPVFLSIGYAGCYWCRVVAERCFADEAVATLLNDSFIPVKVDCLERPDIDHSYQTVCEQVHGRSGWPLSVWLTPELKPFRIENCVAAPDEREPKQFIDTLETIRETWTDVTGRQRLETRAEELTAVALDGMDTHLRESQFPDDRPLLATAKATVRSADRRNGGWGTGVKFPHAGRIRLLLEAYDRTERDIYRTVATESLDAMANRGLYDHVGGGFHRCVTDREWNHPQFEKPLHCNATLVPVYLGAYRLTGAQRYRTVVTETLEFIRRDLSDETGRFYAGLGGHTPVESDSYREDGFSRWTADEIRDAVGEAEVGLFTTAGVDQRDAELFCERYGLDSSDPRGSVPTRSKSVETLAEHHDMTTAQVSGALERARERVQAVRDEQARASRNEAVLAGWNGLAAMAFARAGLTLDEGYVRPAVDAVEFLRERLWDETTETLGRQETDGAAGVDGFLEDYAFVGRAAIACYQVTGELRHLEFALALARALVRLFWEKSDGRLYFTAAGRNQLPVRPQHRTDGITPSPTAVAVELLDMLAPFTTEGELTEIAERIVETYASSIRSNPVRHASLALVADRVMRRDTLDRMLVAENPVTAWVNADGSCSEPPMLAWKPKDEAELDAWLTRLGLADTPPVWTPL